MLGRRLGRVLFVAAVIGASGGLATTADASSLGVTRAAQEHRSRALCGPVRSVTSSAHRRRLACAPGYQSRAEKYFRSLALGRLSSRGGSLHRYQFGATPARHSSLRPSVAGAAAGGGWSSFQFDSASAPNAFTAIACPYDNQCTGVDDFGYEVTFDPQSPGTPTPVSIDGAIGLTAVACPTTTQCTAVDAVGNELTFNPQSPGAPARLNVDSSGGGLWAISCEWSHQCVAVDAIGNEVNFDPTAPGTPIPASIDPNGRPGEHRVHIRQPMHRSRRGRRSGHVQPDKPGGRSTDCHRSGERG